MFVEWEAIEKRRPASHSAEFVEQGRKGRVGRVGPRVRYAH